MIMTEQDRIEYFKNEILRLSNQVVDLLDERDQLKAEVELLRESEAYFKNGMAELQDYIDKMDPELLALRAQVEQLREQLEYMAQQHRCGCGHPACNRCYDDKQNAIVLEATSAQCLADVKAQAGRDGFIAGYFHCRNEGFQFEDELENSADAYANQIRQQAAKE